MGNVLGYWTPFSAVVVISSSVFAEKYISSIKQDLSLDPRGVSWSLIRKKPCIGYHSSLRIALIKRQGKK